MIRWLLSMALSLLHRTLHVRLPQWRLRPSRDVHTTPYGNPLPKVKHIVLRKEQLKPGRVIIVGDVVRPQNMVQSS